MLQDLVEGWDAEIKRAARSEDRCYAEHEARQLGDSSDEAGSDQATLLSDPGEGHRSTDARYSWSSHEETEHGAVQALSVCVARGDAVEAQNGHVEERQRHASKEDGLVVVGHPAILKGADGFCHLVAATGVLLHLSGFIHQLGAFNWTFTISNLCNSEMKNHKSLFVRTASKTELLNEQYFPQTGCKIGSKTIKQLN